MHTADTIDRRTAAEDTIDRSTDPAPVPAKQTPVPEPPARVTARAGRADRTAPASYPDPADPRRLFYALLVRGVRFETRSAPGGTQVRAVSAKPGVTFNALTTDAERRFLLAHRDDLIDFLYDRERRAERELASSADAGYRAALEAVRLPGETRLLAEHEARTRAEHERRRLEGDRSHGFN